MWVSAVAAIVTLAATPLVRREMLKRGVIDVPNHRSAHQIPVPRGGGLACGLGVITGAVIANALGLHVSWPAIGSGLALALVGYLDDQHQLPVLPRLASQVLVGAAIGANLGGPAWGCVGALLVPIVVNVVNFMDGINGITALTMSVWGMVAMIVGLAQGVVVLASLGALITGSAMGFLPWNAPHARVFLGDVGSYLFGALVATGMLVGASAGVSPVVLAAPLAVYLADSGITLGRRLLQRAPVFEAHREHTYQRLVHEFGMPHLVVAGGVSALAAVIAWGWVAMRAGLAVPLTVATLGIFLVSVPASRAVQTFILRRSGGQPDESSDLSRSA